MHIHSQIGTLGGHTYQKLTNCQTWGVDKTNISIFPGYNKPQKVLLKIAKVRLNITLHIYEHFIYKFMIS